MHEDQVAGMDFLFRSLCLALQIEAIAGVLSRIRLRTQDAIARQIGR